MRFTDTLGDLKINYTFGNTFQNRLKPVHKLSLYNDLMELLIVHSVYRTRKLEIIFELELRIINTEIKNF